MIHNLSQLASIILDCVIAGAALMMIWRGLRYLLTAVEDHWPVAAPTVDPADVAMWDVLAEARRITKDAADATE